MHFCFHIGFLLKVETSLEFEGSLVCNPKQAYFLKPAPIMLSVTLLGFLSHLFLCIYIGAGEPALA